MTPQISGVEISQLEVVPYQSFSYRVADERIVGNVDNLEAVQQSVYHILSTERYAYEIYSPNHGVEFEKYKGHGFDYLEATVQKTLRSALYQDDRIKSVTVMAVTKLKKDSALIEFTVTTSRGTFGSEVTVYV